MNKIAYILLFSCLGLNAQYIAKKGGQFAVVGSTGKIIKSQGVPDYTASEAKTILWQVDYEDHAVGGYDTTMLNDDYTLGDIKGVKTGDWPNSEDDLYVERVQVQENYNCSEKHLKITIPAYSYWSGSTFRMEIDQTGIEEIYYEMDYAMRPGWTTVASGKASGPAGYGRDSLSTTYAAGSNDYDTASNTISTYAGFSSRFTWLEGTVEDSEGFGSYIYHKNRTNLWGNLAIYGVDQACVADVNDTQTADCDECDGQDHPDEEDRYDWWDPTGSDTTWIKVIQRVWMNSVPTPGNPTADGGLEMWIDGTLRYRRTNLIWRYYEDIDIDLLLMEVFYGGTDANYPTRNEWILIDNQALYTIPSHAGEASADSRSITPVYDYK